jgi:hypothetical protein
MVGFHQFYFCRLFLLGKGASTLIDSLARGIAEGVTREIKS